MKFNDTKISTTFNFFLCVSFCPFNTLHVMMYSITTTWWWWKKLIILGEVSVEICAERISSVRLALLTANERANVMKSRDGKKRFRGEKWWRPVNFSEVRTRFYCGLISLKDYKLIVQRKKATPETWLHGNSVEKYRWWLEAFHAAKSAFAAILEGIFAINAELIRFPST